MSLTPAMQQYYDLKKQNTDSILFFRMGDFYEMFDEDALIANKVLGIAVTTRNKNAEKPTPLAWFPFHAKEKYLPLFIEAGYKVAIAEQVSDPQLKWIVKREVVRVVTPATIWLESEWFETNNANIICISNTNNMYGLSVIDLSKNKWETCEFSSFWELQWELYKISPREVVLEKKLFSDNDIKSVLEKKYGLNIYFFEEQHSPYKNLIQHFQTKNLEWFWIEKYKEAQRASSLLLDYLKTNQKTDFSFLNAISFNNFSKYLRLDESTVKNLDLVYNFATKSEKVWTLFWVLNATKTTMWKSLLFNSILNPLTDITEIKKRQEFIEEFLQDKILLDKIRTELQKVANINNILNRIAVNRTTPRDLIHLKNSLKSILHIIEIIKKEGSAKLKKIVGSI